MWQVQTGFVVAKVFELHRREREAASSALHHAGNETGPKLVHWLLGLNWHTGFSLLDCPAGAEGSGAATRNKGPTEVRGGGGV